MASVIPDRVLSRFAPWMNCDCWVMCNHDKQPVTIHGGDYLIPSAKYPDVPRHYGLGTLIRWRAEPQDHITVLSRVQIIVDTFPTEFGFGIILGMNNALVCYDFDHCICKDAMWFMWRIPLEVRWFLDVSATYTEVSSSGTGLHVFMAADGNAEEYDFNPVISEGKCYPMRFIKLTGVIFEGYDSPVQCITEYEFYAIKNRLGIIAEISTQVPQEPSQAGSSAIFGDEHIDWEATLSTAGIRFEVVPNYADKTRKHGKTSKWAAKIQCPNAETHTGYESRRNEFNPDVAILTLWSDGMSSVKCNHNHCSWLYKPNLLQKLWNQIKAGREANPKSIQYKRNALRERLMAAGVL